MKTLFINPSKIKKSNIDGGGPFYNIEDINSIIETCTENGDWDLNVIDFSELMIYRSLFDFLKNGTPWIETKLYTHLLENLNNGNPMWSCNSIELILKRGEYLKDLYKYMKETGEIPKGYYEEDDICVSIDREGGFLFAKNGTHRLCISKILNFKTIPVKVFRVHENWSKCTLNR